jgi:hypothetical protein
MSLWLVATLPLWSELRAQGRAAEILGQSRVRVKRCGLRRQTSACSDEQVAIGDDMMKFSCGRCEDERWPYCLPF